MIIRAILSYIFSRKVEVVSYFYNAGMLLCCAEWHMCVL